MAKLRLTSSVIFLSSFVTSLLWLVKAQTISNGVCYRNVQRYRMAYQSQVYYRSYKCGLFDWDRCRREHSRQVSIMVRYTSNVFGCCSGYQTCGVNLRECCPVCDSPCTNGGNCSRPNTCDCFLGWTGNACQTDINECFEGTNTCQQVCVNIMGSYQCDCRDGYRLDSNGFTCTDINECSEEIDRCDHNCHNAIGSYACSCNGGHRLGQDGVTCYDIDECAEGTDECDHQCYNTNGSYSCNCTETGYRLHTDDATCQNINECSEGADGCAQTCTDTDGNYTCSCDVGYKLAKDQHGCDDIDECQENIHSCIQICSNINGSYLCSCQSGYRLDSNGFTCTDINECNEEIDRCDHHCHNAMGSYACSCNSGHRLGQDGVTCYDIDECAEGTDRCDQQCYNTNGSYSCNCTETGYRLHTDDATCQNINECSEGADGCAQTCTDTDGNYTCSCDVGYKLANDQHGCDDIDECQENIHSCNQICFNVNGSYLCSCNPGYRLDSDGQNCAISSGSSFQVRFSINAGSEVTCSQFGNENSEEKASAFAIAISQQISQTCNCPYLDSFIHSHGFFCNDNTAMKTVIYQAKFVVIDGTTSQAIQSTIQNWVLTKSLITVDGQQYELDTSCSIVVQEVGDTSCDAIQPTSSADSQVNLPYYYFYYYVGGGGGALLLLLVTIGMIITVCIIKWKTSRKSRYSVRQSSTAQTGQVQENPAYCVHQLSKHQRIADKHVHEEQNWQNPEYYECPTAISQDGGGGNDYESNKMQKTPEYYELPSFTHHGGGGHNITLYKKRIQHDPECYELPWSSGEDVIDGSSNVYDSVY